jgi:Co/Zn/Cd efflux system component
MDCCDHCHASDPLRGHPGYRRALWVVLGINATMFLVEIAAGLAAGSASLQADALDFLGDSQTTASACSWWAWRCATAPWRRSPRVSAWRSSAFG